MPSNCPAPVNPFRRRSREDITDPRRGCFMPRVVQMSCQAVRAWLCLATASITGGWNARPLFSPAGAGWMDRSRLRQQQRHLTAIDNRETPSFPPVVIAQQAVLAASSPISARVRRIPSSRSRGTLRPDRATSIPVRLWRGRWSRSGGQGDGHGQCSSGVRTR